MAIYSIKDLEKLCGVKAHTLRIWEQRYGIVVPQRTKTNIRYYQDEELKILLNVSLLNKNGFKISKIAEMSQEEIHNRVAALSSIDIESDTHLDALTLSMIEMDEYKFDRIISTNIRQIGFERTMLEVIYPFLDKLNVLWLTGSITPVQEHFISNLVRQKLIAAIDALPFPNPAHSKKFMVFLPEGENEELSLLLMQYLIKSRKQQVISLGKHISIQDLKDAYQNYKPDYLFTLITESYTKQPIQRYTRLLSENFPECEILLSGYQVSVQQVKSVDNLIVLNSLNDMIYFLKKVNNKTHSSLID